MADDDHAQEQAQRRQRGKGIQWVDVAILSDEDDEYLMGAQNPMDKEWKAAFAKSRGLVVGNAKHGVVNYECRVTECKYITRHTQDDVTGLWRLQVLRVLFSVQILGALLFTCD